MLDTKLENIPPNQWMSAIPQLDNLSLFELTLPGTHNAGCDWKASYALLPGKNFIACQDDSFYTQLNLGARALDVRLEYHDKAKGFSQFRFQHNGYLTSRTLEDLVRDVNRFLSERPDEFIILDFHELKKGDSEFNFIKFRDLMLEHLGERMIPTHNVYRSLGQLKQSSALQRVLVTASMPWNANDNRFYSPIDHKWIGQSLVSTTELHQFITKVMAEPRSRKNLWSLSATSFTFPGGPKRILDDLDTWFSPDRTGWAKLCNIINFDFIKDSKIVFYCCLANLEKANEKAQ
jgi:1-phosphatidylinositol phosphodiesterase